MISSPLRMGPLKARRPKAVSRNARPGLREAWEVEAGKGEGQLLR